jgi:hypothetical protein
MRHTPEIVIKINGIFERITTISTPEATKILQHLAQITAHKQQKPYSAIVKQLRLQIDITLVKAAHHCLRGSTKKCPQTTQTSTPNQPSEPSPVFCMLWLKATQLTLASRRKSNFHK